MSALLEVDDLTTAFPSAGGAVPVVDGVRLYIERGEVLALVGESGCGKSMSALSLMRLVPRPGRIAKGSIRLSGRELIGLPVGEMRQVRGGEVSMIFQEPMTSLNPVVRVGNQVVEAIRLHESLTKQAALDRCLGLFEQVGIRPQGAAARLSSRALGWAQAASHDRDGALHTPQAADRR